MEQQSGAAKDSVEPWKPDARMEPYIADSPFWLCLRDPWPRRIYDYVRGRRGGVLIIAADPAAHTAHLIDAGTLLRPAAEALNMGCDGFCEARFAERLFFFETARLRKAFARALDGHVEAAIAGLELFFVVDAAEPEDPCPRRDARLQRVRLVTATRDRRLVTDLAPRWHTVLGHACGCL